MRALAAALFGAGGRQLNHDRTRSASICKAEARCPRASRRSAHARRKARPIPADPVAKPRPEPILAHVLSHVWARPCPSMSFPLPSFPTSKSGHARARPCPLPGPGTPMPVPACPHDHVHACSLVSPLARQLAQLLRADLPALPPGTPLHADLSAQPPGPPLHTDPSAQLLHADQPAQPPGPPLHADSLACR